MTSSGAKSGATSIAELNANIRNGADSATGAAPAAAAAAAGSSPSSAVASGAAKSPASVSGSGSGSSTPRPGNRKRSSSIVMVQKIEQSQEELLDQSAGFNANADWVNYKGAWVIHVVLILFAKILLDVIPAMPQALSWTIVNLGYIAISYIMFHHVTGTPFDSNAGVYDQLTLWEQIDEGAQYTPAKKWLTSVPIGVFLISTHYTRYNLALFALNFTATVFILFPKLPILHRLRFRTPLHGSYPSGANSPYPSRPNTPAAPAY